MIWFMGRMHHLWKFASFAKGFSFYCLEAS